jgi:hypothetical protein
MPPSSARNRVRVSSDATAAIIEVSIPMRDVCSSCHICTNEFCDDDECCRTGVHLQCCTQLLCCKCLVRMCKRCRCTPECKAVVAFCPYCRESVGVPVLDIFRGATEECSSCKNRSDPQTEAGDDDEEEDDADRHSSVGSTTVTATPGVTQELATNGRWTTYFSSL